MGQGAEGDCGKRDAGRGMRRPVSDCQCVFGIKRIQQSLVTKGLPCITIVTFLTD